LTNLSDVLTRQLQNKAAAAVATNAEATPPATLPAGGTNATPAK
jgi:hypothetical protein